MTLMERLKSDSLAARKRKDTVVANLLSTLISEAANVGKNNGNRDSTDEEVARVVKKFYDNANEIVRLTSDSDGPAAFEASILEAYMPQQLTEEQLRAIIVEMKATHPGVPVGAVMGYLKNNYSGQYDGKLAAQIYKEV